MYLVLRIAAILVKITFSDMHICANCLQVIMNLLETGFTVRSTPFAVAIILSWSVAGALALP